MKTKGFFPWGEKPKVKQGFRKELFPRNVKSLTKKRKSKKKFHPLRIFFLKPFKKNQLKLN